MTLATSKHLILLKTCLISRYHAKIKITFTKLFWIKNGLEFNALDFVERHSYMDTPASTYLAETQNDPFSGLLFKSVQQTALKYR